MTSPKPFTAEQLDELEQELELCTYVRLRAEYLPEDSGKLSRLIAQAREEIRLREGEAFRAGAEAFKRAAIENEEARLKRELDNGTHAGTAEFWRQNYTCCYVELPVEDPAARAKRELGEWLVANQGATHSTVDTSLPEYEPLRKAHPEQYTGEWLCWLGGEDSCGGSITPIGDDKWFVGRGPTEADAITAALRAAKGER